MNIPSTDFFKQNFESKIIVIAVCVYVLSFLIFYPSFYASIDEHGYLQNTVRLANGSIGEPNAEYAGRAIFNGEEYISTRVIGKSIFLLPFIVFGLSGAMFSGLVIHLLNFCILLLLFKKLKINKMFSLLYLLLPTFVWASRTLYPGLLVLTFFLAAFYFYFSEKKKHSFFTGLFFGLAVLTRNDAAYGVVALLVVMLFKDREKLFYTVLGGIAPALALFSINYLLYGGVLSTGSGSISNLLFNYASDNIVTFTVYIALLMVFLPLLLISPFFEKKTGAKWEFAAFSIAYLVMNSTFTNFFTFEFSFHSLVTSRLRYLISLIGVLLIPYSAFLTELSEKGFAKKHFQKIVLVVLVLLSVGTIVLSSVHADFLYEKRTLVFESVYSNTPANALIVGSSDDAIFFVKDFFPDRKYLNINPGADLGGNPENIKVIGKIKENKDSYLLLLSYTHVEEKNSLRSEIVESERKEIFNFYEANAESFDLIAFEPEIQMWLYKYNGGELKNSVSGEQK
ncbi:MAG: hypothetical protein NUV57_01920 [archaeon]|nr:hypothetical protein [archaeon]